MKPDYDNKDFLEDIGADFQNFMAVKDYVGARAIVDQLAEKGEYEDALIILKAIIKAEMLEKTKV